MIVVAVFIVTVYLAVVILTIRSHQVDSFQVDSSQVDSFQARCRCEWLKLHVDKTPRHQPELIAVFKDRLNVHFKSVSHALTCIMAADSSASTTVTIESTAVTMATSTRPARTTIVVRTDGGPDDAIEAAVAASRNASTEEVLIHLQHREHPLKTLLKMVMRLWRRVIVGPPQTVEV